MPSEIIAGGVISRCLRKESIEQYVRAAELVRFADVACESFPGKPCKITYSGFPSLDGKFQLEVESEGVSENIFRAPIVSVSYNCDFLLNPYPKEKDSPEINDAIEAVRYKHAVARDVAVLTNGRTVRSCKESIVLRFAGKSIHVIYGDKLYANWMWDEAPTRRDGWARLSLLYEEVPAKDTSGILVFAQRFFAARNVDKFTWEENNPMRPRSSAMPLP